MLHARRLLAFAVAVAVAAPAAAAHQPGWHFAGHGTPTINGSIGAGEWDNADRRNVTLAMPAGGTAPGVLRVMHDNSNLYVSLDVTGTTLTAVLQVDYDSDGSATCSQNDDAVGVNTASFFFDTFRDFANACSNPSDDGAGGTINGSGAASSAGGHMVFEIAHPLDSNDVKDVDLQAYEVVGVFIHVFLCQGACAETFFPPGGSHSVTAAFHTFGLFVDDFELGTGPWSAVSP